MPCSPPARKLTMRTALIMLLCALALSLVAQSSASAKQKPRVFTTLAGSATGGEPAKRPKAIYGGGVGSDTGLRNLKWRSWGSGAARARGNYLIRSKPGSPDSNSRLSWSVSVRLSKVRTCNGDQFFTRATVRFTDGRPNGFSKNRFKLSIACE